MAQVDKLTEWGAGVQAQQETSDEITHLSERIVQKNYKTRMQAKECVEKRLISKSAMCDGKFFHEVTRRGFIA